MELTTKLMEAAQSKGAELRIGVVTGVSMTTLVSEDGESGKTAGPGSDMKRRITGVVLEDGEEIPCERVGFGSLFMYFEPLCVLVVLRVEIARSLPIISTSFLQVRSQSSVLAPHIVEACTVCLHW